MKILLTAFKGKGNASFQLVSQLNRDSLFLTNSFSGLEKEIRSVAESYDAIYMFGVDKGLSGEIRIERCAAYDCNTIYTGFDVQALSDLAAAYQIPHHISDTPTQYLCNCAYYHMLCKNKNTVFLHILSAKGMDDRLMYQLVKLFGSLPHCIPSLDFSEHPFYNGPNAIAKRDIP